MLVLLRLVVVSVVGSWGVCGACDSCSALVRVVVALSRAVFGPCGSEGRLIVFRCDSTSCFSLRYLMSRSAMCV